MAALTNYAEQHRKTPTDILDAAVERFLDYEAWFAERVAEGLAAAEAGDLVDHQQVRKALIGDHGGTSVG